MPGSGCATSTRPLQTQVDGEQERVGKPAPGGRRWLNSAAGRGIPPRGAAPRRGASAGATAGRAPPSANRRRARGPARATAPRCPTRGRDGARRPRAPSRHPVPPAGRGSPGGGRVRDHDQHRPHEHEQPPPARRPAAARPSRRRAGSPRKIARVGNGRTAARSARPIRNTAGPRTRPRRARGPRSPGSRRRWPRRPRARGQPRRAGPARPIAPAGSPPAAGARACEGDGLGPFIRAPYHRRQSPAERAPYGAVLPSGGRQTSAPRGVCGHALSSLREVLDRCVRRRGRRCCDGPQDGRPAVRRRAHALLLVAEGRTVAAVARLFETRTARRRVRPLNAAALAFLAEALEASPRRTGCGHGLEHPRPARWRHAWVSGFRPCADGHAAHLRHRQDEAVAAAGPGVAAKKGEQDHRHPPGEGPAAPAGSPPAPASAPSSPLDCDGAAFVAFLDHLAAGDGPGQRRLPQGAARQGLVDGPAGPGPPAPPTRLS